MGTVTNQLAKAKDPTAAAIGSLVGSLVARARGIFPSEYDQAREASSLSRMAAMNSLEFTAFT